MTKQVNPLFYRSKENWELEAQDVTIPSKEIKTVPNEALTIEELFKRAEKGLPLSGTAREPVFTHTEDFDAPDISQIFRKDVVEQVQELTELHDRANQAVETYDKAVKDKQDAEHAAKQERIRKKRELELERINKDKKQE